MRQTTLAPPSSLRSRSVNVATHPTGSGATHSAYFSVRYTHVPPLWMRRRARVPAPRLVRPSSACQVPPLHTVPTGITAEKRRARDGPASARSIGDISALHGPAHIPVKTVKSFTHFTLERAVVRTFRAQLHARILCLHRHGIFANVIRAMGWQIVPSSRRRASWALKHEHRESPRR